MAGDTLRHDGHEVGRGDDAGKHEEVLQADRYAVLEAAGDRWWPFAGGIYFLHGIKRVHGTRVITPQWKTSLAKRKGLAPVPHRVDDERLVARHGDVDAK